MGQRQGFQACQTRARVIGQVKHRCQRWRCAKRVGSARGAPGACVCTGARLEHVLVVFFSGLGLDGRGRLGNMSCSKVAMPVVSVSGQ